ncbi:type 2 isopentenyl-diphosphate Delta-isomerase [Carnobacterium gallinarum]|uniref:type 2 isopentenyl-diphosphate Delta-isomerase n=1 Tax=Carnobacterium gallinarum TaxID=2749 RepID=UPI00054F6F6C|nr:type 2 isopentenyl-diphosphate Delta-isomerase [Carnobacterium gallinarum]
MTIEDRKNQHVDLAEAMFHRRNSSDYDDLRFVHHSFPEIKVNDVALDTQFLGLNFTSPFYINGMTGGSEKTKKINGDLAIIARETGLAMATGSQSAAIKKPELTDTFQIIRKHNPDGLIFANLGAGNTVEAGKKAVDMLQANVLQIHINAPQELIMPEGDRDFSNWLSEIEKMVNEIQVPILVKEVGFGMSRETIQQLVNIGVQGVDVSGRGGTNFAAIENARRQTQELAYLESWGQSSIISLLEAQEFQASIQLLASGGIRNPLDMVKALALGANGIGISGLFLHLLLENGVEATIAEVIRWQEQIKTILTLLGKTTISDLQKTDLIIGGEVRDWCMARGVAYQDFAKRS